MATSQRCGFYSQRRHDRRQIGLNGVVLLAKIERRPGRRQFSGRVLQSCWQPLWPMFAKFG